jgi:hypothetical protein
MFNPEVSVGDLLTAVAVLVSAIGILTELRKDRLLRRKELSDRVRRSTGIIITKADRWKQLSLRFFDELQPIITDADVLLVKEQDVVTARDFFWREALRFTGQYREEDHG